MWARLEPHIRANVPSGISRTTNVVSGFSRTTDVVSGFSRTKDSSRTKFWNVEFPRWGLAASAAALAVISFLLGRAWAPPVPSTASLAQTDPESVSERLLRTEVEEHLERSQRVLMELVNVDDSSPVTLASDRQRATDLVAAGRLYRRSLEESGDTSTRNLLEDIERVLVEIANGPDVESSKDLSEVRARISDQDLIFRLRVMTTTMRTRERRAAQTW